MFKSVYSKLDPIKYVTCYWDFTKVRLRSSGKHSRHPTVGRCWELWPLFWPWPSQPLHPAASHFGDGVVVGPCLWCWQRTAQPRSPWIKSFGINMICFSCVPLDSMIATHWIQWLPLVKEHGSQPLPMINIWNEFGSAVASAIPLPGPHRNIQKLKNQESPTGADKEISA